MLVSAAAILTALVGFAAAVPAGASAQKHGCTDHFNPKTNQYIDQGCGTLIHPASRPHVCLQTDWDTRSGSALYIRECLSGKVYGGRWELSRSRNTVIKNKQSNSPSWCLTASDRFDAVEMRSCYSRKNQNWDTTDGQYIKLSGTSLCLTLDHGLNGNAGLVSAKLVLKRCAQGDPLQIWDIPPTSDLDW